MKGKSNYNSIYQFGKEKREGELNLDFSWNPTYRF
jgi:hypothetical protein